MQTSAPPQSGSAPVRACAAIEAFSISDLVATGLFSKRTITRALERGDLIGRKYGRRTIILGSDWRDFVAGLPARPLSCASDTGSGPSNG